LHGPPHPTENDDRSFFGWIPPHNKLILAGELGIRPSGAMVGCSWFGKSTESRALVRAVSGSWESERAKK